MRLGGEMAPQSWHTIAPTRGRRAAGDKPCKLELLGKRTVIFRIVSFFLVL